MVAAVVVAVWRFDRSRRAGVFRCHSIVGCFKVKKLAHEMISNE